jgi:hypothetical protein
LFSASGTDSFAAGGFMNEVYDGAYGSFVAGSQAIAEQPGVFVWADTTSVEFDPYAQVGPQGIPNSFNVRATGGAYIITGVSGGGAITAGVEVAAGSGSWSSYSDRNAKTNFARVDPRAILDQVAQMPVQTWSYKAQAASIRHIGPMAQDFAAAFGVGEDDSHIAAVDEDGVALAAIQGLNQKVEEARTESKAKDAEIQELKTSVNELKQLVQTLVQKK